jgi:hypothetical protein
MTTTTPGIAAATTLTPAGEDLVSDAARHLYDAEFALHIARSSGVDAWVAAAYDHLHLAVVAYEAARAAAARDTR